MKIIAITQKGAEKIENEDRIVAGNNIISKGIFCAQDLPGVVAIADGVGGNNAGAVASHFVAERLAALKSVCTEALSAINEELLVLSASSPEYNNMATTLSGIALYGEKACLFSIGNTRVYSLRSGKYLKLLTNDDTTLNYLLAAGRISAEDALSFDRRNEITACFGGGSKHLFKIKCRELSPPFSPFMITSDGIHDYISVDVMEDILAENGISIAACKAMLSAARAAGSNDDISIVLGEI